MWRVPLRHWRLSHPTEPVLAAAASLAPAALTAHRAPALPPRSRACWAGCSRPRALGALGLARLPERPSASAGTEEAAGGRRGAGASLAGGPGWLPLCASSCLAGTAPPPLPRSGFLTRPVEGGRAAVRGSWRGGRVTGRPGRPHDPLALTVRELRWSAGLVGQSCLQAFRCPPKWILRARAGGAGNEPPEAGLEPRVDFHQILGQFHPWAGGE